MSIAKHHFTEYGSVADKLTLQPKVRGVTLTSATLPATGNTLNNVWITLNNRHPYQWNGASWTDLGLGAVLWEDDLRTMSNQDIIRLYQLT
jgi:hypothetical protein